MSSVEKFFENAKDKITNMTLDDVLKAVGLERVSGPFARKIPAIAAFFGGLAIGAGVALALAPASGKDTRKAFSKWMVGAIAGMRKGAGKAASTAGEAVEDAVEAIGDGASDIKKKVNGKLRANA